MELERAHYNMIEQQIRPWEVLDQTVLDVMRRVPRSQFVPVACQSLAYADIQLPLAYGEKMMHPRVEGRMLQELAITMNDSCLEIGTGSGFVTACLSHLAKEVYSIDRHDDFTKQAQQKMEQHHISNVTLETKDAFSELDTTKRYDVIAVTGSVSELSEHFEQMLKPKGRLFIIVGSRIAPIMQAMLITRENNGTFLRTSLFDTEGLPLITQGGTEGIAVKKVFLL
ncbi:MAG TPA: protein-L-isoaspartate O-methyltransferase [Thiothrix sp.]|nr:protein-L-isoaspartate O-methyltransferase [Thiothrix sp.]